jgi:hypothetical protein
MKSPTGQRQRRCQQYISGHYWNSCQFNIHDGKGYVHISKSLGCIITLTVLMKASPTNCKNARSHSPTIPQKLFFAFTLRSDPVSAGACGYHEELLPTLSTARVGFDVRDTPLLVSEDLVTVGRTMEMDEPPRDHWQSQHDTLGMNLYPLLDYAIKHPPLARDISWRTP